MLTVEDLKQIAEVFGLDMPNTIKVKDGYVKATDKVWWWAEEGPQFVSLTDHTHLSNVKDYPEVYSINRPAYKVEYLL